ncbi:hypothetical protein [Streptomyces sp. NPDC051001]|uniref:hypothetical protein n=1 Tax=Streptomyces sp. NPDC051001 TaxID=3155795 RepID=UPI00344AB75B
MAAFLDRGLRSGRELFLRVLTEDPAAATLRRTRESLAGLRTPEPLPPPCWMPENLGEVTSHVCPGGTATLRLRITSGHVERHTVRVWAEGPVQVETEPSSVVLDTFQEETVTVRAILPARGAEPGTARIRVHGCRDHILRWHVVPAALGCDCLHEIRLTDGPDPVHHWYDHFYCARPCGHGSDTHG